MPLVFNYVARDSNTGQKVKSAIKADDIKSASRQLVEKGLAPIEIKEADSLGARKKVKAKDRIIFARQLSTLINAGMPLAQSLHSLQQQTKSPVLKMVIQNLIQDIESGKSFAEALKKYPRVFNDVFVNMVAAGESSGTLDVSLSRLALQQEKDAENLSKVKGAMVYPAVVVFVMIAVVLFMLISVLPQVQALYDGLPGAELPILTKALLFVSDLVVRFWWVFAIILGLVVFFGVRWIRTYAAKRVIDKLKLTAPGFGPLYRKMYMARFSRTGSTLIASGVPLLQMLEITARSINNIYIEDVVYQAANRVKGGKSLADSLAGSPYFIDLVPNMIKVGEQSGQLEDMLTKTADYFEREVDQQIKTINTILEPILMVVLGAVALFVVAAILLPVYNLANEGLGGP